MLELKVEEEDKDDEGEGCRNSFEHLLRGLEGFWHQEVEIDLEQNVHSYENQEIEQVLRLNENKAFVHRIVEESKAQGKGYTCHEEAQHVALK